MTESTTQNNKRNYGIDLLKILSMYMVVVLHVCYQGGLLAAAESTAMFSAKYWTLWLIEAMSYCAVNCYALISGYVNFGRQTKYSNILYLNFQVTFYTLAITGLFAVFFPKTVSIYTVKAAFFPAFFKIYWYFTSYFCMFFFIPFMNWFLEKADKKLLDRFLITAFTVCSLIPTLFYSDMPQLNGGYAFLWLCLLYIAGGYIKKYDIGKTAKKGRCILVYAICVLISFAAKFLLELATNKLYGSPRYGDYLINYISPTTVFCAVALLLFFLNIRVRESLKNLVVLFSTVSFSVYIIHAEPLVWEYMLKYAFVSYISYPPHIMIFLILRIAFLIWLGCSAVDMIRLLLFKLFGIKKLCIFIENKCRALIKKITDKRTNRRQYGL